MPSTRGPFRVLFIGPTSAPWASIQAEVEADLERLARPGVELTYRCTGTGPSEIRTDTDAVAAAPFVVQTIVAAAGDGFDAVVVDCTADPGVAEARDVVDISVVGAGEAMQAAIAAANQPVCVLSGDDLRAMDDVALVDRVRGARTVALGGTGFSHLVDVITAAHPGMIVLDPLAVALDSVTPRR
jgi:allantoin racemase